MQWCLTPLHILASSPRPLSPPYSITSPSSPPYSITSPYFTPLIHYLTLFHPLIHHLTPFHPLAPSPHPISTPCSITSSHSTPLHDGSHPQAPSFPAPGRLRSQLLDTSKASNLVAALRMALDDASELTELIRERPGSAAERLRKHSNGDGD